MAYSLTIKPKPMKPTAGTEQLSAYTQSNGEVFETPDAILKMIRVGVSYNKAGDPIALGAVLKQYKAPDLSLMQGKAVTSVLRKSMYNCKTKAVIIVGLELFDKAETLLSEPLAEPMGPITPIAGSIMGKELEFMCRNAKPKSYV